MKTVQVSCEGSSILLWFRNSTTAKGSVGHWDSYKVENNQLHALEITYFRTIEVKRVLLYSNFFFAWEGVCTRNTFPVYNFASPLVTVPKKLMANKNIEEKKFNQVQQGVDPSTLGLSLPTLYQ